MEDAKSSSISKRLVTDFRGFPSYVGLLTLGSLFGVLLAARVNSWARRLGDADLVLLSGTFLAWDLVTGPLTKLCLCWGEEGS